MSAARARQRQEARLIRAVLRLARARPEDRRWLIARLTEPQKRALDEFWPAWRHQGQAPPDDEKGKSWRTWLLMAGRGFGKTRAGAEWVSALARELGAVRIALVGATIEDVRNVMIEGRSGLKTVAATGEEVKWTASLGRVDFPGGAIAFAYSGENPEKLRGPEHHFAWCDEIAKWRHPDATWHNLQLGLRLGATPRVLVTTTPRPIALLRRLVGEAAVTRGRIRDNRNLPPEFVAEMTEAYGGTRFGRQELDGELIGEVEGALWTRDLIDERRVAAGGCPDWARVVIGVDPPASSAGTCGIVACALGKDGLCYVIGDHSARGLSPEGWAAAVGRAAELHGAERVVAENNQGGEMVEAVLRGADVMLPVAGVRARFGKSRRAEPISTLFVKGKARFAGVFPELEDELCGLQLGGGYEGPGASPDRADAMVWAAAELMMGRKRMPGVRRL